MRVQVRQDLFLANDVEKEIKNKSRLKVFITPCYDRYSIANVPPTILSIFQAKAQGCERLPKNIIDEHSDGVHKIVLLIVDSMGYKQFFNCYPKDRALKIVADNSNLIPITSTFPSTTTTALTTLSTGATPREHGIIGYTMYLKGYGFVVNMIDFAPAYDYKWGTLLEMGLDPKDFLGLKTIYEILNEEGIKTHAIMRFKDSGLSKMNLNDAKISTYVNSSDLFVTLRRLLEDEDDEEAYFCAY
ncbi:MAG: alkaline phosphatase family protein [Nitrososphaerales archaeon]|nr:alkaline phosphatase family protein [Nitrososphaerales archaeon]